MKKFSFFFCLLLLPLLLTGCFALPAEAPVLPPPIITQPVERTFYTVPVSRGDIRLEANPFALYMPARIESQRFAVDDIPLLGIFVSVGDEVLEGDIIAALYLPEIQQELDDLNRSRTRLNLELQLLRERHELATNLAEEFGGSVDSASFLTSRANLNAELELLDRLLTHVNQLNEERYLRATMDGVITSAETFIEGMTSNSAQTIAVISDQAFSAFIVQGEIAEIMNPGDRFVMTLGGIVLEERAVAWLWNQTDTIGDDIFLMEVIDPNEFGFIRAARPEIEVAEAFLAFVDAPPAPGFDTFARLHIPLEEVSNVLYIPTSVLHRHGERDFVYMLEDGVRTVRDVVIGLEGGGLVEIISGLAEGELIIR